MSEEKQHRIEKHRPKCEAFAHIVRPIFQTYHTEPYTLYDFCCGNGLTSRYVADSLAESIVLVDIADIGMRKMIQGKLPNPIYVQASIIDVEVQGNAAVVAVHACGGLTDRVLEKAVEAKVPFGIMPCCYRLGIAEYDLALPPDARKQLYKNQQDYYDTRRIQFAIENGFEARIERIDSRISPMNNVLVGIPRR
ncbi:MAG: SAM-dependent methyltransferase [Nanoarchaeota archaeon]|nr:SAM-dependent methyltransferase [Nanoarchaeota archaeon]